MSKYHKLPTHKLEEILNSHHCTGIDGADFEPIKEELQAILWERYNSEVEAFTKQHEQDQKAKFKHDHKTTSNKRNTAHKGE